MSETVDERFAPPEAHVADVVVEGTQSVELAGRWIRLGAAIIDTVIMLVLGGVGGLIIGLLQAFSPQTSLGHIFDSTIGTTLFGVALFLLVQAGPLVKKGQTVGKIICKLRIVRTDGSHVDAWRMLGLRYGIGFLASVNSYTAGIYGLIDSLAIFRQSRQCLHDTIADTKVIKL